MLPILIGGLLLIHQLVHASKYQVCEIANRTSSDYCLSRRSKRQEFRSKEAPKLDDAAHFVMPLPEQKHPKDQTFYKTLAYTMGCAALNSQYWQWYEMPKNPVYHFQRYLLYGIVPIATVSQVIYLVLNHSEHEFTTLSMMYTILPVSFILSLKLSVAQTSAYKAAMKDFMNKIHLYNHYIKNQDHYVEKVLISAEKFTRWSGYYYMGLCYICYGAFEIVPIIHNFQNNESIQNITSRLEIIIHLWLPFDYEFNFRNWIIVQTLMVYCGFCAITLIVLFDTVNLTFLYHLIGHVKIIKHRLRTNFPKNISQEETKENLIEISQYYTFIRKTLKDVEAAFGLNVACIYLHNLVGGGLFLYQLMTSGTDTGTIFTYGLMIPIYMGMLIIMSMTLENIRIKADDIPDLVYGLSWEQMSPSNQKLVLMILFQVQPTLEFMAAFNIKTGVKPAISIIKTTFSYYVMIKSNM